ncbi:hypothetical protein CBF34_08045 [Vagococcus penaei]|uniref:Uncharacterized protein n=1 Tax=Vagococcus penaei TaxID=633807 RepID=A0A1Q2D4Y0_9ENTE|nr:DUF916 and DUF3324 domain-containing protein [Vagococcus penaei]AQP53443.1 hypothetical protein BW732_03780 [Vagococcus penaei]RSU00832.1 hypothetical protein CBF34_08045 [Vagococcus penaei]
MDSKKNVIRGLFFAVIGIFIISFNGQKIYAADTLAVAVNAILPENQRNKEVTYYDLQVTPEQKQELEFELINSSKKSQTVQLQINNATTNDLGNIDYSDRTQNLARDTSLKIALTDIAEIPNEVVVPANSQQIVKIKLTIPKEPFEGEILGGIRVTTLDEDTEGDASAQMTIKNKVAYTIGLSLTESDEPVKVALDLIDVKPVIGQGIQATIQNSQPLVIDGITYHAKVTKKGQQRIIYQTTVENYRFAPNSTVNLLIDGNQESLQAGIYDLTIKATTKKPEGTWTMKKEFT